ncbi:unnamed protein product [Rhizopus stolonifer]
MYLFIISLMTHQTPHPNSPHQLSFPPSMQDISVKEILEHHSNDTELLKCILTAKSEEDKKTAARDMLRAEEARIQLRHMDLELAREQHKPSYPPVLARYKPYPPPQHSPYPHSAHPLCPNMHMEERRYNRNNSTTYGEQISHSKVMEALKAKIQRGHTMKDTKTLFHEKIKKPILPPIDTSIRRASQSESSRSDIQRSRSLTPLA